MRQALYAKIAYRAVYQACCLNVFLRILPLMVLGISRTNSTLRIHLYSARRRLQESLMSISTSRVGG